MKLCNLIFIISILTMLHEQADAARTKQDTYQVYINAPDQSIRASVLTGSVKMKADIDRTYYWYGSNKIMETKGGFDGKLLHGEFSSFYLNNNLKEKGVFRKGLKHGEWISWYDNGAIKDITVWKNGKKEGRYRSFTSKGEPVLEAHFVKDNLHGKVISYENGKVLGTRKYRKGKEVIKKPKPVKEKKSRKKNKSEDSLETKEGVNTTTPPVEPQQKRSIKEKIRSLFISKKKNTDAQPVNEKTRKEKKIKKNKDEKAPAGKKQERKSNREKEQDK